MEIYYTALVFIYGLLLGSFYNVVGYRIPNNLSIVKPGSFCPKCKHELKWYELFPVFSFLIQGGKCRKCKCKISLFYPFIELLTAILFTISYIKFGFGVEFILSSIVASFFVIVIVSDFSYLIIPDEVTLFFALLAFIVQGIMIDFGFAFSSLFVGFLMFVFMYLLMLIAGKIMHEEALGGGDVKLMFFIGIVLNFISPIKVFDLSTYYVLINGFFELFLASCFAAPFAIISYFSKKKRIIPFGPFILGALLVIFMCSLNFVSMYF